ncbi:MAG: type IV pilus assembly protein PilM [Planctomycetota bacterium]
MANRNESWGIEVGSDAIKAVKLSRDGDSLVMSDFAVVPYAQVLTTPDVDAEESIRLGLDQFLQQHEMGKAAVVASVPGNLAFARFAKLPPVEPKKVREIVRFEAQQQIPFPIDEVEWDYQVFQQEDSPDVEVGIFAITKERVARFLSNFRSQDLRLDALTLSPVAVYNAFSYETAEAPPETGTVLLDVGTVSTDVIVVEPGSIWLRTFSMGGNHFTEALVRQFKISFAKAEKLKREAATSKYAKQIFQAMKGVYADLVQEVQRSLGYYQSINRESNVAQVLGLGSTFRLPGLVKYVQQNLQMPVHRPDGFERVEIDGKRESEVANEALNLSTAYGLALQGLGLESVTANILPSHILAARQWKSKQPWIVSAAACTVVAAGLAAVKTYSNQGAFEAEFEPVAQAARPVVSRANSLRGDLQDANSGTGQSRIEEYRQLADYRGVQALLKADIDRMLSVVKPPEAPADYDPNTWMAGNSERDQWWRVFIQSVEVNYVPGPLAGAAPARGGSDDDRRGRGNSRQPEAQAPAAGGAPTTARYEVVITGSTPYPEAPVLTQQMINWLRDNAEGEGRPYTFYLAPGGGAQTISRVGSGAGGNVGNWEAGGNTGGNAFNPAGNARFNPGGGNNANNTSIPAVNLAETLPDRGAAIQQEGDFQFTLRFQAVLKPREAYRGLFQPPPTPPAPPAEARSTGDPVPDSPRNPEGAVDA